MINTELKAAIERYRNAENYTHTQNALQEIATICEDNLEKEISVNLPKKANYMPIFELAQKVIDSQLDSDIAQLAQCAKAVFNANKSDMDKILSKKQAAY